jgi:hypothetical protein
VDDSTDKPVLVIGAGIPKSWLSRPICVVGVGTATGTVDWKWADGKVTVRVADPHLRVVLAPVFPASTDLSVNAR